MFQIKIEQINFKLFGPSVAKSYIYLL